LGAVLATAATAASADLAIRISEGLIILIPGSTEDFGDERKEAARFSRRFF